ncbi:MAG: polysaccharide pyruvyl transferase family protein [Dehalococcoidia bacterium]
MKKVIFAGAYGIRSQGDDAALISMVEGLRRRLDNFDGVVIARHAHEEHYAPYELRCIPNIEYEHKSESIGKWFRGFNYDDDRSHLRLLQQEISTSDLLVLGASNFLVDVSIDLLKGPIPYLVILTLMAKMVGTPVMWFGISVGPFRTDYGRALSRLAASMANAVTVRDQRSVEELAQLGYSGEVVQLPDPVLGLRAPRPDVARAITYWRQAHDKKRGPIIVVSVRDIPPTGNLSAQQYIDQMARVCDGLASRHAATLLFIPQCTYEHGNPSEDDRNVARWVVEQMQFPHNAIVVNDHLTVEGCLALYSQADVGLCTRLHGNVYAAIQGVPSVAVSYLPKVAEFMRWLGCADLVVALPEVSSATMLERLEMAIARREEISNRILARVQSGRTAIEQYIDIACAQIAIGRQT